MQFDFNCVSPSYVKPDCVGWETSPRPCVQALPPTDRPSSGRVMIPLCGPAADQQAAFVKQVRPCLAQLLLSDMVRWLKATADNVSIAFSSALSKSFGW